MTDKRARKAIMRSIQGLPGPKAGPSVALRTPPRHRRRDAAVALAAVAAAGAMCWADAARAAGVAWNPPATLSGDADVFNAGTANYAYDLNNSTQTVNGVTFTGSSSTTALGTDVALGGVT